MGAPRSSSGVLQVVNLGAVRFLEASPDQDLIRSQADARLLLEACFSNNVESALLYSRSLPPNFFDLSSGEAGAILQALRNYGVRIAVVVDVQMTHFSSRFGEMAAEERGKGFFRLFTTRSGAVEWLCGPSASSSS